MYVTMMSVILGGVLNMIFCKTSFYKKHRTPMDFNKTFKGKRIFGDNKTWIGFLGMIVSCIITQVTWGCICKIFNLPSDLYLIYSNTVVYNLILGFLFGFLYMLFELPNSFLKRQIGITPGKTENRCFFVIDQIDSLLGVMLVLFWVSKIDLLDYVEYVLLGGFTHIAVNLVLYKMRIRRNL